jgi:hypothetical protein
VRRSIGIARLVLGVVVMVMLMTMVPGGIVGAVPGRRRSGAGHGKGRCHRENCADASEMPRCCLLTDEDSR